MPRKIGLVLVGLAVLVSGCSKLSTSPVVEKPAQGADALRQSWAVEDGRHVVEVPTDAPELRNIRVAIRGDRLVMHAQLDLNGWTADQFRQDVSLERDSWTIGIGLAGDPARWTSVPKAYVHADVHHGSMRVEIDLGEIGDRDPRLYGTTILWGFGTGGRLEAWALESDEPENTANEYRFHSYTGATVQRGQGRVEEPLAASFTETRLHRFALD